MENHKTFKDVADLRDNAFLLTSEGDAVSTVEDWRWWILDQIVGNHPMNDDVVPNETINQVYWIAESVWDFDPVTMQAVTDVRKLLAQ